MPCLGACCNLPPEVGVAAENWDSFGAVVHEAPVGGDLDISHAHHLYNLQTQHSAAEKTDQPPYQSKIWHQIP